MVGAPQDASRIPALGEGVGEGVGDGVADDVGPAESGVERDAC